MLQLGMTKKLRKFQLSPPDGALGQRKIAFLHVTELSIGFNGKLVKATKLGLVCYLQREGAAWPLPFSSQKPRRLSMTLIPLHFTDYKVAPTEVAACSIASCITEKANTDQPRPAKLSPSQPGHRGVPAQSLK